MNILILIGCATVFLSLISGWFVLSSKKFAKERVVCFFLGHKLDKKELVQTGGALFQGSICRRCKRYRMGKFVFNYWDDSKTEIVGNTHTLSGLNPRVEQEGWKIVGDHEQLEEISEMLCKKIKGKKKEAITQ